MSEKKLAMEIHKEEIVNENGERTRDRACFVPRTDVFETEDAVHFLLGPFAVPVFFNRGLYAACLPQPDNTLVVFGPAYTR